MSAAPHAARAPVWIGGLSAKTLGLLAVLGLVVAFSLSSTLVKRAETAGVLVAFWRLATVSLAWNLVLWSTGRRVALRDVRAVWIPGVFFGLNLAVFFAGATHNSVANAALIGSCAPFLIVPVGAWLFRENIYPRALVFALLAVGGVALVLLNAPPGGDASLEGNVFGVLAMFAAGGLRLIDAVFPPRDGRDDLHGDDLPDRDHCGAPGRRRPRRHVLDERHGLEVHADPGLHEWDHRPGPACVRAEDDSNRDDRDRADRAACARGRVVFSPAGRGGQRPADNRDRDRHGRSACLHGAHSTRRSTRSRSVMKCEAVSMRASAAA